MKWTEFVVSEDLERMKKYHLARRKTGGKAPSEYEFCFRDKKGNIKNIFLKISIIPGTKKSVSSLMDITERKQAEEKLKKTMDATLETMSKIIEVKDPYTAGHQQRVSQLAVSISKELNFLQEQVEGIKIASLIHDIGKIGIPTEILNKSIALSDIEFSLIKAHSQIGYDILKSIDFSYPVAEIVLQHHEKIDGSGYPKGLKGDDISLEAKIICVADVVEAMSSHRPYRPALGSDKALEEISKNKGILYDTIVVNACVKLFKEKGFKWE
jgi:putative nucleotidyltransferase with HDIG domain